VSTAPQPLTSHRRRPLLRSYRYISMPLYNKVVGSGLTHIKVLWLTLNSMILECCAFSAVRSVRPYYMPLGMMGVPMLLGTSDR
jgi:hypothetical protein